MCALLEKPLIPAYIDKQISGNKETYRSIFQCIRKLRKYVLLKTFCLSRVILSCRNIKKLGSVYNEIFLRTFSSKYLVRTAQRYVESNTKRLYIFEDYFSEDSFIFSDSIRRHMGNCTVQVFADSAVSTVHRTESKQSHRSAPPSWYSQLSDNGFTLEKR